ncbi:hypothetical protein LIER_41900 [Lithospermum erythrorhizon]|uniref:Reverse transcriptase n=1 Tax=Lithospermum erythrorhizon TaxID=34254 RepID=A0AAV3RK77_LITER
MSKLLSSRFSYILPKLIFEFQAGFVHGRLIQANILLAQELVHHIDKGKKEGNATSSHRRELGRVIPCHRHFLSLLKNTYSEDCINFTLTILSLHIRVAAMLVFQFLDHYQSISGQLVSKDKSSCVLSTKATPARCSIMQKATYLGIPIFKGKRHILLELRGKLSFWSTIFLSFGGRIKLLQSVLTTLPIYHLNVMQMPAEVYLKIERTNFCGMESHGLNGTVEGISMI